MQDLSKVSFVIYFMGQSSERDAHTPFLTFILIMIPTVVRASCSLSIIYIYLSASNIIPVAVERALVLSVIIYPVNISIFY